MMKTAKFDDAKHDISLEHQKRVMQLRYVPFAQHVSKFHSIMAGRFSQMQHVIGTDRSYDPIMSDA